MSKAKNKKNSWTFILQFIFGGIVGGACGVLLVRVLDELSIAGTHIPFLLLYIALVIMLFAAIYLQTIIHEAGHLVFGLLTGYKFSSFRIGSFMFVKKDGNIRLKRFSLAGTAGQCLMSPPDMVDGKLPVMLYNLGGSIMNIIASFIFLGIYFLSGDSFIISSFAMVLVLIGVFFALTNGIPMRMGYVDNDGKNAVSLRKNKDALFAFWMQLKVNDQITNGVRLKNMPNEWFAIPSDEDMKNGSVAVVGVFACNKLMDEQRFNEADETMEHLLKIESGISGLHRSLMICDRIYCELIGENRKVVVDKMLTKQQKKLMKSMKSLLNVIRTEYAYALLVEKDQKKAEAIKAKFEKRCKTYPHIVEVESERELIAIVDQIASSSPVER